MDCEFPAIHLYALLAIAVTIMTHAMSRDLAVRDEYETGFWPLVRLWIPCVPVVLAIGHLGFRIRQELRECYCGGQLSTEGWNLMVHLVILGCCMVSGAYLYYRYLAKLQSDDF